MSGSYQVIKIGGGQLPLTIAIVPELGGSLLEARWRDTLLTRPTPALTSAITVSNMTSFVMAPFANRIDAGHFVFGGQAIKMPINRANQNVAIHGVARNRAWQVVAQRDDALELSLRVDDPDYPFHFDARQHYQVTSDGWSTLLSVTNRGSKPLPFGLGHHPYFRRAPDTVVNFKARGYFPTDPVRNLPITPSGAADAAQNEVRLEARDSVGLDKHYYGWSGEARVSWPDIGLSLDVLANRSLGNAHLYFSPDEESVCVEPVSHVPDVHNHPEWGSYGGLTVLAPGKTLTGTMRCRVNVTK
jgi:aldose 1-epimerase